MGITITSAPFGTTAKGEPVTRYVMRNAAGMEAAVLSYGCTVQSICVPTAGEKIDVALGYDDLRSYEAGTCFFGAFVGRYANRIKGAHFWLNGREYTLEKNDGDNHLHGVYCKQVFAGAAEGDTLVFRRVSPDGEEGFPGALTVEVRYRLTDDNALEMEYLAQTDADTVVNLTNHTYFNLNGGGDILGHRLTLCADRFTEGNAQTLPTGRILQVEGTPMDFRAGRRIGEDIGSDFEQIRLCRGYDHNFVLSGTPGKLRKMAEAEGDASGIRMEAFTTQPAVQLYTGNYVDLDGAPFGKGGVRYPRYAGFCLESQHYPCAPNFPEFPSTLLRPGEEYREKTVYRFFGK